MSTRVITRLAAHRDEVTHLLLARPGPAHAPAIGPAAAPDHPHPAPGACPSDDHETRHPRPEPTIGRTEARSRYRPLVDRERMPPREVVQVEEARDRNRAVMKANHAAITGGIINDHSTMSGGRNGGAEVQGEDMREERHVGSYLRVCGTNRPTHMTKTMASVSFVD
jgi:hypothetical protein